MSERAEHIPAAAEGWPDGVGMIYLGMSAWDTMWKSRHQLMSRFSRELPVLYVEPAVSFRAVRTGGVGVRRLMQHALQPAVKTSPPSVNVMRASAWHPLSGSKLLASWTRRRWLRSVQRAARAAGIKVPILWVCRPEMRFAVGQLGERLSIYHIVDEYSGYTGLGVEGAKRLRLEESALLDAADMAVAASPEIIGAKRAPGRDFVLLENGVSFAAYTSARSASNPPADVAPVAGPRIGYSGLIGKRLNLDLIADIAAARPDWSIVMVGKVDKRECESLIERLQAMRNVYFLGEKPAADVPRYVCSFDVGLLPYAINLETKHISPIKMYEYWAAGIPVVGTGIPSVRRNSDAVFIGESREDFVTLVESALEGFSDAERQGLIERAERNSWGRRVDAIGREIAARLGKGDDCAAVGPMPRVGSPSWKGN